MNFVLDDTIRIPGSAAGDLAAFRRWTKSADYPERGDFAFLNGDLWADMSMETFLHNQIKGQIAAVLTLYVATAQLGHFFADRMRLVHEDAGLSAEPDAMFVSSQALRDKRVRLEDAEQSLEVIGVPEMVLEVVSSHSIRKDTVILRDIYAAAGIAEYWLVNPLKGQLSFDIWRLSGGRYVATPNTSGWTKSTVFGKSFRLLQEPGDDELPEYRLELR
ncbi:MAG: Uma2 family endonuclease [Pirellulaceae bacterium]